MSRAGLCYHAGVSATSPAPVLSSLARPLREPALWAAVAVALVLRLVLWAQRGGPAWFEEDVPVGWALRLWGFGGHGFDPNPHSAIWPHLSVYVWFLVQAAQVMVGRLTGHYAGPADLNAAATLDPDLLRGPAMLAAILIGLVTIVAAARLAQRLAGRAAGPWVALVLAFDPLFLRHALVVSPDMLLTLFTVLGLLASLDVLERGRLANSLRGGLWLGLGTACKYAPALLAVPLVLAHAWRPGGRRGAAVLGDGRLWGAAAVSVAAFALTTPFTFLDLAKRWSDVVVGANVLTEGPAGAARHFAAPAYLFDVLPHDLGLPLYALLLGAAAWVLRRRARPRLVLLAFLLVYLAVFGLVPTPFPRYLLPAYPPALALGAAAVREALAHPRLRRAALAACALAMLGLGLSWARFMNEYLRPDARALARDWFLAHVPDGAAVLVERAGPELPDRMERGAGAGRPGLSAGWRAALARGPAYWVDVLPMSFPDPEISGPFYDLPACAGFDLVVTSTGVSARYLADPARFAAQSDFYAGLERFADVAYRSPGGRRAGPTITVYRTVPARRAALEAWWAARAASHAAPRRVVAPDLLAGRLAVRARVLGQAGHYAAALTAWRAALAGPGAPAAWWLEDGLCAQLAGDGPGACRALETAWQRDSSLTEAGLSWAETAAQIGRRDESRRALEDLRRRGALDPEARARIARVEAFLGGTGPR